MKALTIREPWASAIVFGTKRIESRSWEPPSHFPLPLLRRRWWLTRLSQRRMGLRRRVRFGP